MIIRILPKEIVRQSPSEEHLLEDNILDVIYELRAHKAAIELADTDIEVTSNASGQVFIATHDIWIRPGTWERVRD